MALTQPPSARLRMTSAETYGLVEEEYAHCPFQLLIICIFLNKTKGERAIPQARRFLWQFPDPESLAQAQYDETVPFFESLGLQRRAQWVIDLAKKWLTDPPTPGVLYTKSYGAKITCESEVAHLKGIGRYASDAWRIFCKDDLYQKAGYTIAVPEWTRVSPQDKELRAYLDWKHRVSARHILNKKDEETDKLAAHIEALSLGDALQDITCSKKMVGIRFKDNYHVSIPARLLLDAKPLQSK